MKFSAVIVLICAFLALSHARSVAESTKEIGEEKRFFPGLDKIALAIAGNLAKIGIGAVKGVCDNSANDPNFPEIGRRACLCAPLMEDALAVIGGFLGDEPQKDEKRNLLDGLINGAVNSIKGFCNTPNAQSQQIIVKMCSCVVGI